MQFTYGVTATVERPAGADRFGNPLAPTTHEVAGVAPAPGGSTEQSLNESIVEWDLDLLGPVDADIRAEDIVTLPGDPTRYQVVGRPQRFRHPMTNWQAGSVTRLKGVEG